MVGGEGLAQEFGDAGVACLGNAPGVGGRAHHDDGNQTVGAGGVGAQLAGEGYAVQSLQVGVDDQDIKGAPLELGHGFCGIICLADIPAADGAQHAGDQ
ncbi:hypothetical protein GCM10007913_38920 [Devosia yakushimensis]|uniref:Uncharacterized protein n=1 Tax=Devosia yakushimensis TaxID=470028 RepID=A0ABQ5UJF6_9HYPH|nr:hypothetical protein [Devosia yakushimensis]GLQ11960.1 hypothetical protein GCM10007913_38920 [Devosia yakushimensis]